MQMIGQNDVGFGHKRFLRANGAEGSAEFSDVICQQRALAFKQVYGEKECSAWGERTYVLWHVCVDGKSYYARGGIRLTAPATRIHTFADGGIHFVPPALQHHAGTATFSCSQVFATSLTVARRMSRT